MLFGDRQWKGRQGGLNSSIHVYVCVCASISWQYSDFHTLQNKMSLLSIISFNFFFCTYVCIKLNFTCVCLPPPSHSLLKEHWSWVSPVFILVHREETRGKNTNGSQILEKDRVQLHDGVVKKKHMKRGRVCLTKRKPPHFTEL